ncbi:MAG: GtrA family protein [Bacteroidota bacterium]|nr:GtrA family protein [Bacteroidota bacterium]
MNRIKKQLIRFIVSGFSAVITDAAVYWILLHIISTSFSKGCSFICGSIVAYTMNKFWTFEQRHPSRNEVIRFIVLYSFTLLVNIFINRLVLYIYEVKPLAFLCSTATSTIINFIGQKFWVFKIELIENK